MSNGFQCSRQTPFSMGSLRQARASPVWSRWSRTVIAISTKARPANVVSMTAEMTTDSAFAIFSTTKAITGTAILQLVEQGKLDLDAPAKNYAPDIGKLQVIEGFDAKGEPKLRPPKRDVTTRMLMVHTAGFGYDFFSHTYNRLAQEKGQPSVITSSKASL